MSESNIEWTDLTWNPVRGCRRVSPGCQNCYAEKTANRFRGAGRPYHGLIRINSKGKGVWTGRAREVPEKLAEPLSWRQRARLVTERQRGWDGESGSNTGAGVDAVHAGRLARHRGEPRPRRLRVFVNSMSDLFHEDVSFEFVAAVYGVMAACPDIDFLVLTKRPARMAEWYEWIEKHKGRAPISGKDWCISVLYSHARLNTPSPRPGLGETLDVWPLPNVHVGVSVEDQQRADERIPLLLKVPAAVRWVSCEPLLTALNLVPHLNERRRDAVPCSSSVAIVRGSPRRVDMEASSLAWWRRSVATSNHTNQGGAESIAEGRLYARDVSRPGFAAAGRRTPDCLDVRQPETDSPRPRDQSQGRQQTEQRSRQPRNSNAPAERRALSQVREAKEKGPTRRGQRAARGDRRTGPRDSIVVGCPVDDATRDRGAIRYQTDDGEQYCEPSQLEAPALDWVVIGGESGPGARPYDLSWGRALIEQCKGAGVPVFHKQLGSGHPAKHKCNDGATTTVRSQPDSSKGTTSEWVLKYAHPKGADMSEWPADLRVREYPEVRR